VVLPDRCVMEYRHMAASQEGSPRPPGAARPWVVGVAAFLLALLASGALFSGYTALQDTDSYYHLALARRIAREGIPQRLDWARMTVYAERFGDPVLGFHLLLAPFARGQHPEGGALVALALLDAALLGLLAALAAVAIGRAGFVMPFVLVAGSTDVALRLVRLRPELLAVLLLILAGWLAGTGRHRLLGVVAAAFALSYSAVHAFVGCWLLLFLFWGWSRRRWEWSLPLYATLGVGVGLVLHPRFPANVEAFGMLLRVGLGGSSLPGSGGELQPHTTWIAFFAQLGLWGVALAVWAARTPGAPAREVDGRLRDVFGLLGALFGLLYLQSARFSLFAFPCAALWLLFALRARGERVGRTARLFGREVPLALCLAVCALLGIWPWTYQWGNIRGRSVTPQQLANRRHVAASLPAGAKVAADWGYSDLMVFYAPQARYLDVLDPLPMWLARPATFLARQRIWHGEEHDVPWATTVLLDSDYLLVPRFDPEGAGVLQRLAGDPRIEVLDDGPLVLVRWRPGANRLFVRPWRVAPPEVQDTAAALSDGVPYPWDSDARGRAVEGFVDLRRVAGRAPCRVLSTLLPPASAANRWGLAPAGPTAVTIGSVEVARFEGSPQARLTDALYLTLPPRSGPETLTLRTCGSSARDPGGFYFWRADAREDDASSISPAPAR
jgi:hypothetical protein